MANTLKVTVNVAEWGTSDVSPPFKLSAGAHTLQNPPAKVKRALAAAHAAGEIIVKGDLSTSHIEADKDSLKAQEKAQASGEWQKGNVADHIARLEDRIANADEDTDVDLLKAQFAESKRLAKLLDDGVPYDEATRQARA